MYLRPARALLLLTASRSASTAVSATGALPNRLHLQPRSTTIKERLNRFHSVSSIHQSRRTMSTMTPGKCLIAVCQLTSTEDKAENLRQAEQIVREAAGAGCRLIFLPECFDMVCETRAKTLESCEPLDGPIVTRYRQLAKELQVHLFLGGLHERNETNPEGKCSNAHIAIDPTGEIVSVYRKLHLFNLDVPGTRLVESEFSVAGDRVQPPVETPAGELDLS